MQEENNGTTLSKFFKTVWRQKWIALIVAVLITLLGAVTLYYGYNPAQEVYVMEFSLNLPGDDNSLVYIYPNGTQFYYSDMTSLKTLQTIKATDPAFKDIDVENMANNGHINIKRDITVMADTTVTSSAYREISYTIGVKASYFENESRAKSFLIKLANSPADYLAQMQINYGVYLNMAESAEDYEDEIALLKSQLADVQSKYATLIKTYGDSFVVDDGKTLLAYSQEVQAYSDSNVLDNLLTEAQTNYYIKSEAYRANYRLQLVELQKEYDKAYTTLQTLLSINGGDTAVVIDASVIKAQQDLVTDLDNQIKIVTKYADESESSTNAQYEEKVVEAFNRVKEFTDDYSTASATVYGKASSVVYLNPGIVAAEGGMSLIKIVIISLVVGIIIALIAGYMAGYLTLKKEKTKAGTSSSAPANAYESGQIKEDNNPTQNQN